jgi:hypothetical protein
MFARWSQENFFAYMRNHYGLDKLISYDTEQVPETTPVVNPAYRRLEGAIRQKTSRVNRVAAQFGGLSLEGDLDPSRITAYETRKARLQEKMTHLREELVTLKAQRKETKRHIFFGGPADARFERLAVHSKHLINSVKEFHLLGMVKTTIKQL